MKRFLAVLSATVVLLIAIPGMSAADMVETVSQDINGTDNYAIKSRESSSANSSLTATTDSRAYARLLSAIEITCTASTTIAVSSTITRSGGDSVLLNGITLTATTFGALYSTAILLLSGDTLQVSVPAGGAGNVCTVTVTEVVR